MAKQKGIIKIVGTIGGLTFYETKYGSIVKEAGQVSKEKRMKDESHQSQRDSSTEFSYASNLGKLLRYGVKPHCPHAGEGRLNHRLTGWLRVMAGQDPASERGKRQVQENTVQQLEGFEWSEKDRLGAALRATVDATINKETREVTCTIPKFAPGKHIKLPNSATHVELTLVAVTTSSAADKYVSTCARSGILPLIAKTTGDLSMQCVMPELEGELMMAGIGVQGFQEINGEMVGMKSGCAFAVVKAVVV